MTGGSVGSAAFLYRLREMPALMDSAPAGWTGDHITRRTQDEIHLCLRCDKPAQVAYVAHTKAGPRWLDLCALCAHWARRANELGSDPDEP